MILTNILVKYYINYLKKDNLNSFNKGMQSREFDILLRFSSVHSLVLYNFYFWYNNYIYEHISHYNFCKALIYLYFHRSINTNNLGHGQYLKIVQKIKKKKI